MFPKLWVGSVFINRSQSQHILKTLSINFLSTYGSFSCHLCRMVIFDCEKVVFAQMFIFNCQQIKNFITDVANSVLVYNTNPKEEV